MDGLLIDSEPIWQEVEIDTLSKLDVPIDHQNVSETQGMRNDQVVKYWYNKHPWDFPDIQNVENEILKRVRSAITSKGKAMPCAKKVVELCKRAGYSTAIASSSPISLINDDIQKLDIADYIDIIHSGYDEINSKPHPAIFLGTAKKLGVSPGECVVFEDSTNGVLAAKRAGMFCIAVPPKNFDPKKYRDADIILNSLTDFDVSLLPNVIQQPLPKRQLHQ